MAYGLTIINQSGRTTIDENSRQIQVLKTGTIVPKPIGRGYSVSQNSSRFGGSADPSASPIIVPGTLTNSLIFFHPKRTSGTGGTTPVFHVGAHLGTCTVQWTSTAATVSGTNYIYASYTVSSATRDFAQSGAGSLYGTTTVNNDPLVDTLGDAVGSYGQWSSGSNSSGMNYIENIEATGTSGVYKLTLTATWNSTGQPSGSAAKTLSKKVVWFYTPNDGGFVANSTYNSTMQNQYTLEYKFGKLSEDSEETSGYGMEVYNSAGRLAFSSNRVNFQIESITTGDTDVVAGSQTGKVKTGTGTPTNVIFDVVDFPADFDDYYVMLTGAGDQAAFAGQGSLTSTYGSTPYQRVFGVGYAFSPVGTPDAMNSSMAGGQIGVLASTQSIGSANGGISMSSILHGTSNSGSQVTQNAYVHDTWALEASRSLVIGRFI